MQQLSPWSSALSVRNAQLDEQHIVLIELATELIARLTSGNPHSPMIYDLLTDFVESVRHHDALEEVVLIRNGCPHFQEHAQTHRKTEAELLQWLERVRSAVYDHRGLVAQLSQWVQHHLIELDIPVVGYLSSGQHHPASTLTQRSSQAVMGTQASRSLATRPGCTSNNVSPCMASFT